MRTQNSYVTTEPYSRVPGDRNWRHRVVDMDVFVRGPLHMLPRLQEVLKGNNIDVDGLTVRTCFILLYYGLCTYFTAYSSDHSTGTENSNMYATTM